MAQIQRRQLLKKGLEQGLRLGAGLLALPALHISHASTAAPVRLLVGFPAGGGTDAIARLLAYRLKAELGVSVFVENRPGAGGQLAALALKAAAPDGNTMFLSHDHTVSILPLMMRNPGFNPIRDFVPVVGIASFANAVALSSATPARSLADYVAWVRSAGGGKGSVGVAVPASVAEFLVKVIAQKSGLDLQPIPYQGGAPMMQDMLGQQIAAGVGSVPALIDNHRAGRLRIVAVMGAQRQAALPDIPTLAESGIPGFEELPYYGVFGPRGTPTPVIDAFSAAMARVLAKAEVRERLTALGLSVAHLAPAQLAARERAYTRTWAKIIRDSGFQPL